MFSRMVVAAQALAIGACGGLLFQLAQLPLPWMLGSMVATTIASFAGARIAIPRHFRNAFVVIIGVMLGSAFTPELIERMPSWLPGLGTLALFVPTATLIGYVFFRRTGGFEKVDAFFSAAPGGLSEMVLVGEAYGGDPRKIALVHAVRVLIVVFVIPFYFRFFFDGYTAAARSGAVVGPLLVPARDAAILIATGIGGWTLGAILRLPAHHLIGPMLASACVHMLGLTGSKPPFYLVAIAQVIMGSAIGCRFSGVRFSAVRGTLLLGLGATLVLLFVTIGFTLSFRHLVPVDPSALTLALAPGGLAEMTLVALALAVDSAFVSCMHIVRISFVILFAPLAFRLGWRNGD